MMTVLVSWACQLSMCNGNAYTSLKNCLDFHWKGVVAVLADQCSACVDIALSMGCLLLLGKPLWQFGFDR